MNGEFYNKKVVVTGPRHIHPDDRSVVFNTMLGILKDHPNKVVIGGAKGVDTAAFIACAKAKLAGKDLAGFYLEVVLPGYLGDAPSEFREALAASHLVVAKTVSECMDRDAPKVLLVELGMDVSHPQSFHTRNLVMLGRAGWSAVEAVLMAFPGIRVDRGGTQHAIDEATRQGMKVVKQPVRVQ